VLFSFVAHVSSFLFMLTQSLTHYPILSKFMGPSPLSAKPDAVIVATGGRDCVPFLKAAKATGFNERVPFFMHTATELSTLKPLGLQAPEGVIGTSNYFFYYPETAANKSFVKKIRNSLQS